MPAPVINAEWLNLNALRNYPLSEEALSEDDSGSFRLPNDFLVDFQLPIQAFALLNPANFFVSKVSIFGDNVTVTVSYFDADTSEAVVVGSFTVAEATFTRNQTVVLQGTGEFADSFGKAVIGDLTEIFKSAGTFNFALEGGRLETRTIEPNIRGLSGLQTIDADGDASDLIQGDVIIEAGRNFQITAVPDLTLDATRLILSAIDGFGTIDPCECEGDLSGGNAIFTINKIKPDSGGNFQLEGDDCLQPEPIENGLKLRDQCSKPCCGCAELEDLISDQDRMRDQVNSLVNTGSRLEQAMANMQAILATSVS
jgi:hypothetical protein